MNDLQLSSFQFSFLSTSTYFFIYGLMQIPVGLITDRYGLRKSLLVGVAICAVSITGFACSGHFFLACFFRVLLGLGSSFGFICLLISIYEWMPRGNTAFLIGFSQFIGTLGPMLGAGPLNSFVEKTSMSWRSVFIILGIIGLLLTIMVFLYVDNHSSERERYRVFEKPKYIVYNIKKLLSRFQPWAIGLFSACVYIAIEFLSISHGKAFIMLKGHSSYLASYMVSIIWLGYALGCPLVGLLSDFTHHKKNVMIGASIVCILATTTLVFSIREELCLCAFFLLGCAASGQGMGFVAMAKEVENSHLAVGFGVNNTIITVVAAINALVIGLLLNYATYGVQTTLNHYEWAFSFLIVVALFSLVFSLCIKGKKDLVYLDKKDPTFVG